jgi:general secretion pathway protein M
MKTPRDFYQALSARDRRVLQLAASVVGLLLGFYVLNWSYHYYDSGKTQLKESSELLAWMHGNRGKLKNIEEKKADKGETNLLGPITETARKQKITLDRVQPENESRIRIWVEAVEFQTLMRWLDQISQHNVQIESVTIERSPDSGIVSVQVMLSNR